MYISISLTYILLRSHLNFFGVSGHIKSHEDNYTFDGLWRICKQKMKYILVKKLVGCQFRALA